MNPLLKLHKVPALHGLVWLRQGFRAMVHRPMAFSMLFACVVFAMLVVMGVPLAGFVIWAALLPVISLGFMIATQHSLQGSAPMPTAFFLPFQVTTARTRSLLALCVIHAVLLTGIGLFGHWIDNGKLAELSVHSASGELTAARLEELVKLSLDPVLQNGMRWRVGLMALLMLVFWYAPPLVHWGGHSAGKALFFSVVAVWRNKLAFALYLFGWLIVINLMGLLVQLAAMAFGPAAALLAAPGAVMMLFTLLYTSLFFTFIDAFEVSLTPTASAEPAP